MCRTFWTISRLSLTLIFFISGCTSQVRAPVDNRDKSPVADKPASYSQSNGFILSADKDREQHVVVKGDTLYSIAWRYGYDYRDIASWNNISDTYVIYPGQSIRLKANPAKTTSQQPTSSSIKKTRAAERKNKHPNDKPAGKAKVRTIKNSVKGAEKKISWRWPTKGKLIKLNTPTAKKGVDIAGSSGQKIDAAADGDVVYSGSGLLGYGKLIIIKHNDTFLSAYAHNEMLYAKEGDRVKAGQKIATMGLGNKGRAILHFEIRKNGVPVNPLQHLPRDSS